MVELLHWGNPVMVWLEVADIHCFELVVALLVQELVETVQRNLDLILRSYNSKVQLLRRDMAEEWLVLELVLSEQYNSVQFLRLYNNMEERLHKDIQLEWLVLV
uniref:(northern house mosquito) hypothetical protein n=1 Tax=Culex pipiens TaxID=7175 RepID=A0A8D8IPE9_CULPI